MVFAHEMITVHTSQYTNLFYKVNDILFNPNFA